MKNTIYVTRSSMPAYEEYCEEIKELWNTHYLTNMGSKHRQLEVALKSYLGISNLTLFTNGHLALESALAAMNFPKGGEVITSPFTFASTTHAIVRNGLIPVFCDIIYDDYTIDPSKIEALITDKTCAIVPIHVYGNLCHVEEIQHIADKNHLKVIYDAAHAFGVLYNGKNIASFGDVSMFSFHATKVFHTIEGGAVVYSDPLLSQVLDDLKNFGIHGPEEVNYVGGNAKMNEFQASMGICNLRHIDSQIEKRKLISDRYRERLIGIAGIKLNQDFPFLKSNYGYFPVLFDHYKYNRDEIFELLRSQNIMARKYFYPLTNKFACYQNKFHFNFFETPVAEYVAGRILALPIYADLSIQEVDKICKVILG